MPLVPIQNPNPPATSPRVAFLFLDIETSQLDPTIPGASILEIAYVACDSELEVIRAYSTRVRPLPGATYSDWSRAHLSPDLLAPEQPDDSRPRWNDVARALAAALQSWGHAPYRIAGWSPQFDSGWLSRSKILAPLLSHRVWDCSTLRGLDKMWGQEQAQLAPSPHRALDDCMSALAYLRAYRQRKY
jgi:oligoribonuclease (3'-5' exoribonuclease)